MTSTSGPGSPRTLRLASAQRRLRAFLNQILDLESSDFPHPDGREALELIKEQCQSRLRLISRLPQMVDDRTVDEICADIGKFVSRYTDVLGFILRSTNVRNAFEVHFPLKRLIHKTISSDAKLVMSSEWKFVPFTYPMNIELLEEFVLVGGPAPESGNMLIVPLAGHEIGHSAWRHHGIGQEIPPLVTVAVDRTINERPTDRDRVLADIQKVGNDLSWLQNICLSSALLQLEELFCDMFGLYVFGHSYLYAYEYFLAPGSKGRDVAYPGSRDRVAYLKNGAQTLGLEVPPDLFEPWLDSQARAGTSGDILMFADAAVAEAFPAIRDRTFDLLRQCKVPMPSSEIIARVTTALHNRVPDGEGASLAEIVTAGWLYLREKGGLSTDEDQPEHLMLNELTLKSVEVSEFLLRVNNAQRP